MKPQTADQNSIVLTITPWKLHTRMSKFSMNRLKMYYFFAGQKFKCMFLIMNRFLECHLRNDFSPLFCNTRISRSRANEICCCCNEDNFLLELWRRRLMRPRINWVYVTSSTWDHSIPQSVVCTLKKVLTLLKFLQWCLFQVIN